MGTRSKLLILPYPTMTFLPFYVAEESGFFAKRGVIVRCLHAREAKERRIRLCIEGAIDFYTSISTTVEAILRGWGEVRVLCTNVVSRFVCMARPDIKSVPDLKGRKIMVGGGHSKNEALYWCSLYGWEPGKDIEIISQGDATARIDAFRDPTISAILARPQYLSWGEKEGFRALSYPPGVGWCGGGLSTSLNLIKEDPGLIQNVVSSVVEATEFVLKNEEQALEVALKRIPYLGKEEAEGNYRILKEIFTCRVEPAAIHYMAEVLGVVKQCPRKVNLEEVADLSFLRQALDKK